jgi:hypothetical protein
MREYTAARLIALHDQRWSQLSDWRNRWEELSFYIMPQQRSFTSSFGQGNRRREQLIYDSTALEANDRLATRMHEALTNPATNWFKLQFEDEELNANDTAREWLEACETQMISAIRDSNFDMTVGQFYLDVGCLGTSILMVDEKAATFAAKEGDFHGLTFKTYHLGGVGMGENVNGIIDEQSFLFDMTAEQLVQKFDRNAPKRAHDMIAEGKPDHKIKVLLCRFRRTLEDPPEGPLLPRERPFAEVWVNYSDKEMIHDGGTYEQAAFVGRWRRKSEDYVGYGPGERALPTIRTVNEAERLELGAWAKVIDPPIKTRQNNVLGDMDIQAKGITVVRDMDATMQWDLRPDLNHHMIQLEDKRFQIREIFKYHSLELPAREQVGEMTAYEVSKRIEQIYRALGPTVVQLQADVLDGLVQRVFGIMYRKGVLPQIPEEFAGSQFRVSYVGPMALAARAVEIDAIDKFVADSMALADAGLPAAADLIDIDKMQRYKAQIMGVPAIVTRNEDEVKEIREARAELEEKKAQAEQFQQRMAGLKDGATAVGPEAMQGAMEEFGG